MSNEVLHIENFAGIKNADIELGAMNVFIGPQASGKSVCAKLLFFFKECLSNTASDVFSKHTKTAIVASHKELFAKYFPRESWIKDDFSVRYISGEMWMEISRKSASSFSLEILYAPLFNTLLADARKTLKQFFSSSNEDDMLLVSYFLKQKNNENGYVSHSLAANENYFVPAGRSFFSTIQTSIFQLIANGLEIDPFLVEFGKFYEATRRRLVREGVNNFIMTKNIHRILCGTYQYDTKKNKDYIVMDDDRRVPIEVCSSGQQETLPLVLGLLSLTRGNKKAKANTVFIEEPEAHLYPTAQRETVHLIASTIDFVSEDSTSQCVITTHSPYILTALNNLMYAGRIVEKSPDKRKQVTKVIEETALIPPSHVRAYFFENGKVRSIIDPETQLILASELDSVSDVLSIEFDKLMSIEYREAAA